MLCRCVLYVYMLDVVVYVSMDARYAMRVRMCVSMVACAYVCMCVCV